MFDNPILYMRVKKDISVKISGAIKNSYSSSVEIINDWGYRQISFQSISGQLICPVYLLCLFVVTLFLRLLDDSIATAWTRDIPSPEVLTILCSAGRMCRLRRRHGGLSEQARVHNGGGAGKWKGGSGTYGSRGDEPSQAQR